MDNNMDNNFDNNLDNSLDNNPDNNLDNNFDNDFDNDSENNTDNSFENDFYGYEPQKPMTEKSYSMDQVSEALDTEGFQPQKPLLHPDPYEPPSDEQGFNPIRHTAVYADNRFVGDTEPQQTGQGQTYYPAQPDSRYYGNDAAQPLYDSPSAAPAPPEKKRGMNTALMVVIIVLGAMLAASLCGIVAYSVYKSSSSTSSDSDKKDSPITEIPGFTIPGYGNGDNDDNGGGGLKIPSTTVAPEHKESDFSDKAIKDYAGLQIADKPEDVNTNPEYNAEYAFKAAADSVVSVLCFDEETDKNSDATSQGSGIVISEDGFIITNAHVVGNSKTAYLIKVVTADGKEYKAGVVGFDARTDLAVLKLVDAKGLKPAVFGDSDKIELGEDLIVIGNPGGIEYQNSMTKGIVSAINRDASSKNIVKYIQTDAAINPGNSGGPAVNSCGQVIGVASAKIADEKYEGMGFCIPSAQVKQIVDSLIRNGYVDGRVKIGVSGNAVGESEAQMYNLPKGIIIYGITEGGPCDNTDLRENDIITEFDGKQITSFADIYEALEGHKEGDKVKLKFYRQDNGKEYEIEITLQADK